MTESTERQAAHERLSTGGLSRWMRRCATNPWRVIGTWLGILAVLVVLTISFAGSLRDEFEIPGSDTQKATDLIEAEFAEEQGGVLNVVFAAPPGQRLDTPERKQAIDEAIAQAPRGRVQAHEGQGRPRERRESVHAGHGLRRRAHRVCGGPVRPRDLRQGSRGGRCRPGRCPRDGRARGRDRGVQRRRGVSAHRAGNAGAARPARGPDRPAHRLPDVRGDVDPARARHHGRRDRVPPALPPCRTDRYQHDHAAARVDDRDRCRHRLLALHRHAVPSAPARRHVAGRCRSRGGRVSGPGGAVRRPDGRNLRERPRHLRPRLRDEARHRLGTRRPHHRA